MDEIPERPSGITALAIFCLATAILGFIASFLVMWRSNLLTSYGLSPGYLPPAIAPLAVAAGDVLWPISLWGMLAALLLFIAARGLWAVEKWGWWMAVIGGAFSLLSNLITIFQGGAALSHVLTALLAAVVLGYLFSPNVRKVFGRA